MWHRYWSCYVLLAPVVMVWGLNNIYARHSGHVLEVKTDTPNNSRIIRVAKLQPPPWHSFEWFLMSPLCRRNIRWNRRRSLFSLKSDCCHQITDSLSPTSYIKSLLIYHGSLHWFRSECCQFVLALAFYVPWQPPVDHFVSFNLLVIELLCGLRKRKNRWNLTSGFLFLLKIHKLNNWMNPSPPPWAVVSLWLCCVDERFRLKMEWTKHRIVIETDNNDRFN